MQEFDVAIIGAGLAGLHLARRLGATGARVLLVDRKPTLTYAVHTTGIFVRRTLEDFEFPADCLGPVIRHVTLYSPRGRPLELESPRTEFRIGRMGRLYAELLNRCRDAGAQVRLETCYAGSEPTPEGSIVRLRMRQRESRIRTRFLVGADGATSHVAADLGLSRNTSWLVGIETVYRNVPLHGAPRLHCFLEPRLAPGYLAWAAHDGDEVHLGVAGDPSRFQPLSALREFVQLAGGFLDMSHARFAEQRSGRIPMGGVLPQIANRRGLLVGDAAGAVSPLTAGGLDPCLRLSDVATDVVRQYLDGGDPEVLVSYDGRRFRAGYRTRRMLRGLFGACRSAWVLEFACAVLRLPALRCVAERVFFGDGSFPDDRADVRSKGRRIVGTAST
jgi:flavin-dependent dehydrogenase